VQKVAYCRQHWVLIFTVYFCLLDCDTHKYLLYIFQFSPSLSPPTTLISLRCTNLRQLLYLKSIFTADMCFAVCCIFAGQFSVSSQILQYCFQGYSFCHLDYLSSRDYCYYTVSSYAAGNTWPTYN
jgi:hypothetical protein